MESQTSSSLPSTLPSPMGESRDRCDKDLLGEPTLAFLDQTNKVTSSCWTWRRMAGIPGPLRSTVRELAHPDPSTQKPASQFADDPFY